MRAVLAGAKLLRAKVPELWWLAAAAAAAAAVGVVACMPAGAAKLLRCADVDVACVETGPMDLRAAANAAVTPKDFRAAEMTAKLPLVEPPCGVDLDAVEEEEAVVAVDIPVVPLGAKGLSTRAAELVAVAANRVGPLGPKFDRRNPPNEPPTDEARPF